MAQQAKFTERRPARARCAGLVVGAALSAMLPSLALATEGGMGRPIAATTIQSNAGIVPDVPITVANFTSVYFDGSIKGNVRTPVGGDVALHLGAELSMNLFTLMKVWNTSAGAWNFSSSITVPLLWNAVTADVTAPSGTRHVRQSDSGSSDILVTPITAGYHFSKLEHVSVGLGIWAPTGSYDKSKLANNGLNYWTFVPTVAYTRLLPDSGVELSLLGSVQFNTRNKATDYQSAPLLVVEALAMKELGSGWRAGLVAGWIEQLADDHGGLAKQLNGFRGRSVSIGPVVALSTKVGNQPVDASLQWAPSVDSKNRVEGNAVMFTATIPF